MPLGIFACKTLTLSQLFSFFKEQLGGRHERSRSILACGVYRPSLALVSHSPEIALIALYITKIFKNLGCYALTPYPAPIK